MIRAVANLLLLWIQREFIGNAETMQIRAEFTDERRDPLKPAVQ
jgi:hypothetical protein